MANKLSQHELELLEYSFFSLSEEIDLVYCKQLNKGYFDQPVKDVATLKGKVS